MGGSKKVQQPKPKAAMPSMQSVKALSKAQALLQAPANPNVVGTLVGRPNRRNRSGGREAGDLAPLPLGNLTRMSNEVPNVHSRFQKEVSDFQDLAKYRADLKKARKARLRAATKTSGGAKKRAVELLPPAVSVLLDTMEHPEEAEAPKGVFQLNNINSGPTATFSQEANFDVAVVANSTVTVGIWPGHGIPQGGDDVSNHQYLQSVGSTVANIGPTAYTHGTNDYFAGIGFISPSNTLGTAATDTSVATTTLITPDVPNPINAFSEFGSGHSRWRLIALSVEFVNRTAASLINGQVEFVQPENKVSTNVVTQYSYTRNYELLPPTTSRRVWYPRTDDWSYWHTITGVPGNIAPPVDNGTGGIGMFFFLSAAAAASQTYRFKLSYHWECAGAGFAFIATPERNIPSADGYILPAMEALRSVTQAQGQTPKAAAVMAASQDTGLNQLMHAAEGLAGQFIPGVVAPLVSKLLPGPLGDLIKSMFT